MPLPSEQSPERFPSRWIFLIYFGSGLCSLIDEVIWVRLLKLVLGNTVYASSVVVSTFFGGLALGALIMSRYADRIRRPLRTYAVLELCATAAALLLPFGLRLVDPLYAWLFRSYEASPAVLLVWQVVFSAALLLVPTLVMGSTLPLLARYVTTIESRVGRRVGRLYALNTLGAAIGTFSAGLVLIRSFGVMGALYVAAGVNLLVALGGFLLSRTQEVEESVREAPAAEPASGEPATSAAVLVLCAAGASGLISIGYELLWMRSVVFLLGGFTYVFSAVLTVYLIGNVIGVWIGSRLSEHVASPGAAFGVSLTVLGALGVAYLPMLSWWERISPEVMAELMPGGQATARSLWPLAHSVVLFLIPSIAMGVGFPLALQTWTAHAHAVGRGTGTVYGVNTIGAVVGGVAVGFAFIPLLGVQQSVLLLAGLGLWLGVVVVFRLSVRRGAGRWITAAAALSATIAAVALVPADLFVSTVVSAEDRETVAVREGTTATVSVSRKDDHLWLESDGVHIGADDHQRAAQQILGHLGVLLHPGAKETLSIGFGSGETTACLAKHDLDRIDCVEIEPEVVNLALDHFGHVNLGDALDEHVDLYFMDGKNFVRLTDRSYDVIVNGANIPSHSGSAPMFTREHFKAARNHLNPGGVFVTKVHLLASRAEIESILGTFADVFPHATVWFPTTRPLTFLYLVGSREPQRFSVEGIRRALADPGVRENTNVLGLRTEKDLLSCYVADETDIRRAIPEFEMNSDDTPFVEFNLDHSPAGVDELLGRLVGTPRSRSIDAHLDFDGSRESPEEWGAEFEPVYQASGHFLRAYRAVDAWEALAEAEAGLEYQPMSRHLRKIEGRELERFRGLLRRDGPATFLGVAEQGLTGRPEFGTPWLLRAWAQEELGDEEGALLSARNAVELAPSSYAARQTLAGYWFARGNASAAADQLEAALRMRPLDIDLRWQLAQALAAAGRWSEAAAQLRRVVRRQPENEEARRLLDAAREQERERVVAPNA